MFFRFLIACTPDAEQGTCDFFPVIYAHIVAPSQGQGLSRSKAECGGLSCACQMIFVVLLIEMARPYSFGSIKDLLKGGL